MEQETPSSQGLEVCRVPLSSLQLCPGCWGPHLVRIPEAAGWEAQAGLHSPDFALYRITSGALKTTAAQTTACRLGQKVGTGISSKDPPLIPCVAKSGHLLLMSLSYSGQYFPLSAWRNTGRKAVQLLLGSLEAAVSASRGCREQSRASSFVSFPPHRSPFSFLLPN